MNKVVALAGTEENDSSYIREPFPRLPSQLALIGCRRSGKTTLVANLLTKFWLKPSPLLVVLCHHLLTMFLYFHQHQVKIHFSTILTNIHFSILKMMKERI